MVEKRKYETVKDFAKDYRKEIIPMLKSKGFTLSVNTSKGSYWNDGRISFVIKKVPNNFYVWTNEYSRYNKTEKSNKLLNTIRDRVRNLIAVTTDGLDVDLNFDYHRNVRYKPIPEGWDDEQNS